MRRSSSNFLHLKNNFNYLEESSCSLVDQRQDKLLALAVELGKLADECERARVREHSAVRAERVERVRLARAGDVCVARERVGLGRERRGRVRRADHRQRGEARLGAPERRHFAAADSAQAEPARRLAHTDHRLGAHACACRLQRRHFAAADCAQAEAARRLAHADDRRVRDARLDVAQLVRAARLDLERAAHANRRVRDARRDVAQRGRLVRELGVQRALQ